MKKILDSLKKFWGQVSKNMKSIIQKIDVDKIKEFLIMNRRYFLAAILFLALLVVLYNCTGPQVKKDANKGKDKDKESTEFVFDSEFEKDTNKDLNELITNYFTANADGNIEELEQIAYPISNNEKSYIGVFSQYIEGYENISCYTKSGLTDGSYFVSAYFEMKFYGVDTLAPGVNFFYVETNEDGKLYINNLYSAYNLSRAENEMDATIYTTITKYEQQEDVKTLHQDVTDKYDAAVASDVNLASMITTTIPTAMREWIDSVNAMEQVTEENTQETTEEDTEQSDDESTDNAQEEQPEEQPQPTTVHVKVTSNSVNVRSASNTNSNILGKVNQGSQFVKLGVENDWTKIDYNGTPGYIKTEFVQEVTN